MIPLVCAMYSTLPPQDYVEMAKVVQVEAARNTDDEFGVAASVMNRVYSNEYPNTIKDVINSPNQYEGIKGDFVPDHNLVAKLASPKGQLGVCSALNKLDGRTDFKGQAMLQYKHFEDPMFHPKGNFYHYNWQ